VVLFMVFVNQPRESVEKRASAKIVDEVVTHLRRGDITRAKGNSVEFHLPGLPPEGVLVTPAPNGGRCAIPAEGVVLYRSHNDTSPPTESTWSYRVEFDVPPPLDLASSEPWTVTVKVFRGYDPSRPEGSGEGNIPLERFPVIVPIPRR
jgi:hypothetical protein